MGMHMQPLLGETFRLSETGQGSGDEMTLVAVEAVADKKSVVPSWQKPTTVETED